MAKRTGTKTTDAASVTANNELLQLFSRMRATLHADDLSSFGLRTLPEDVLDFCIPGKPLLRSLRQSLLTKQTLLDMRGELSDKESVFAEAGYSQKHDELLFAIDRRLEYYSDNFSGFGYRVDEDSITIGSFSNGLREGRSVYIHYDDCAVLYGTYRHGEPFGETVIRNDDGLQYGVWMDGVLYPGKISKFIQLSYILDSLEAKDEFGYLKLLREIERSELSNYRADKLHDVCEARLRSAQQAVDEERNSALGERRKKQQSRSIRVKNHLWAITHTLFCLFLVMLCEYACRNWIWIISDSFSTGHRADMWYMLLFTPTIAALHTTLMETDTKNARGGMRAEQYIFLSGLCLLTVASAFYSLPLDTTADKAAFALYTILPVALATAVEFGVEAWGEAGGTDMDNAIDVGYSFAQREKRTFGARACFLLYVVSLTGFLGGLGYALQFGMNYSAWHILWIIPSMQLASAAMSALAHCLAGLRRTNASYALHCSTESIKGLVSFGYVLAVYLRHPPVAMARVSVGLFLTMVAAICLILPTVTFCVWRRR